MELYGRTILGVALVGQLVGCEGGPTDTHWTISTVQITNEVPAFVLLGDSVLLEAIALDETGATIPDPPLVWTSSNPGVATVDASSGLAVALGEGTTTIVARAGSARDSLTLAATPASVTYKVVFDAEWSASTHPTAIPPDPHFSGLIGATHSSEVTLWAPGALASPGIKNMAETGQKAPLDSEIEAAIQAGGAATVLSGPGIGLSPGAAEIIFDVTADFPLVTLVSMIAPSPDWFVGVHDLPLLANGTWQSLVVLDLFAYDAGTDSGVIYDSPNSATVPPVAVARITMSPFDVPDRLGTFTFTRQ